MFLYLRIWQEELGSRVLDAAFNNISVISERYWFCLCLWFFIILTVWYFLLFWQCDIFYCSDSVIFFIVLTVIFFCFSFNNLISFIGVWSEVFITGFASGLTRQMPLVEQEVLTIPEHLISPPVFQWGLCYLC